MICRLHLAFAACVVLERAFLFAFLAFIAEASPAPTLGRQAGRRLAGSRHVTALREPQAVSSPSLLEQQEEAGAAAGPRRSAAAESMSEA